MKIAKKCRYCGKKFIAKTIKTKYCSHPCNQKHWKIRKKREKKDQGSIPPIQDSSIIPYDIQLSSIKEKEYLTIKEVMTLLSISRTTLYRLIKKNYLGSAKVGFRVMVRRKDIDKLINDQITEVKNGPILLNSVDMSNENGYLYISEIPEYYDISKRTIERAISSSGIEKFKRGKFTFLRRTDIRKLLGKPKKPFI